MYPHNYILVKDLQKIAQNYQESYHEILNGLQKGAISDELHDGDAQEAYRVIVHTSFSGYQYYLLKVFPDGTGTMEYLLYQPESFEAGRAIKEEKREMTKEETKYLQKQFRKNRFWDIPTAHPDGQSGLDGWTLYVEGYKAGRQHLIAMWCPESEYGIVKIVLAFVEVAQKLKILES